MDYRRKVLLLKVESIFEAILQKHTESSIQITTQSRLIDDLGLCSFDMMVIIAELEEISGKKFNFNHTEPLYTVQDLLIRFENKG